MSNVKQNYGFIDKFHYNRRKQIISDHPEIRSQMVGDPSFKYVAFACSATHLFIAYLLRDAYLTNIIPFAMFVGTLFTCTIANSMHELVHDNAFPGYPFWNKVFGTIVNFGYGWPALGGYYRTHRFHHAYLGTNLDAKYPSIEESAKYDQDVWGRIKFIFSHPLTFGERWTKFVGEEATPFAVWNYRAVWAFNIFVILVFSWRSYLYLIISMWLNDCLYIQGSKNFADHWVDNEKPYARSHYGWWNYINYNIGYHREHHDFPNIPGRYLPEVTKIAKEYYSDPTNIVDSLFGAVWDVLTAPPGKGLLKHANKLNVVDQQFAAKKD